MARIGRLGPIHGAPDYDRKLVAVPKYARTGIGDLWGRQHGAGRRHHHSRGFKIEQGFLRRNLSRHAGAPAIATKVGMREP
jgi:hypothetical protein